MIVFLFLVWSILLLVLIHIHLDNRDSMILSSFRSTLDTLAELIPSQSQSIADSILKAAGILSVEQSRVSLIKQVEQEVYDELKKAEEDPYEPPWEVDGTKVSQSGEWR